MKKIVLKYLWVLPLLLCALTPLVWDAMFGTDFDDFGRKHKIPDGLVYHLPLDPFSDDKVLIDSLDKETYLQVWPGFQGGIYTYDFYYPSIPAGEIFLRCYEVTEKHPFIRRQLGAS